MLVKTVCPICAKTNEVEMTDEQYAKYSERQDNGYVQDVGLNPDDFRFRFRETSSHRNVKNLLLTGLCEECWKKI